MSVMDSEGGWPSPMAFRGSVLRSRIPVGSGTVCRDRLMRWLRVAAQGGSSRAPGTEAHVTRPDKREEVV